MWSTSAQVGAQRGVEAAPAVGGGLRRLGRAQVGQARVAQGARLLHQLRGGGGVVGAHVGHRAAGIVAPADGHEGVVAGHQPLQLGAVEGAAQQDAAVGEAQPAVLGEDLALRALRRRR